MARAQPPYPQAGGPARPSWNEAERVAALRGYGILDTPPEAAFDEIARIAALVLEAPIAVVNLIEDTRQFFKAEIGLGVRETPLDVSICAHALLAGDLLVVPDTTRDPRFACNPLVTGAPHLRFYAGALLETPRGLPIGTLCVLDHAPRPDGITPEQTEVLRALARAAMAQIELRRAVAERDAEIARRQEVERENGVFRSVIEQSSDSITIADPDGRTLFLNEAGRRLVGLGPEEVERTRSTDHVAPEDGALLREVVLPVQERDGSWSGELRLRHARTGALTPVHHSRFSVRDATGARIAVAAVSRDITGERRQRRTLEEREAELARVQRIGGVGGLEVDLRKGGFRNRRSPEYLRLHGLPPEAADETHEDWVARLHPDDRERVEREFRRAVEDGTRDYAAEYRIIRPSDGEERWIAARAEIERDEAGRPLRLVGAHLDVTERRRAEEALRVSEERLRLAVHAGQIGMWDYDLRSDELRWDERTRAIWGLGPDTPVTYAVFLEGLHPEDREEVDREVRAALDPDGSGLYDIEYRVVGRGDGITRWVAARGQCFFEDGRAVRFVGTARDVSRRKEIDERLRASEARLRRIVEASPVGLVIGDAEGRLVYGNPAVQAMLGYGAEEFEAGRVRWSEITPPEFAQADARALRQLEEHGVAEPYEKAYLAKDGRRVPLLVGAAVLPAPGGGRPEIAAFLADLTPLRRAEREAQARRRQFERMTVASPDILYIRDLATERALFVTDRIADVLGYGAGEFTRRSPEDFAEMLHPDDREGVAASLRRMRAMGDGEVAETEYRLRHRDGHWVWILSRDVAFERAADGSVATILGAATPITARKEAEERQKLLVRELHHRIKNTLATVQAVAGLTMRTARSLEEFQDGFAGRIVSLGKTHTLLTERAWGDVGLRELLRLELDPYDEEGRITLSGPEVRLSPDVSVPLGMAFHELTTNATKYGALSLPAGRLDVAWEVSAADGREVLRLAWTERDGPPVVPPTRRGFGSQLLQRVLRTQLQGDVAIEHPPSGLRVRLEAALAGMG
jgi:PAS domain S-box-containing protein